MNLCPKCGAPLEPNAKFCSQCGAAVPAVEPQPAALQPIEQPPVAPQPPMAEPVYSYAPQPSASPAYPAQPPVYYVAQPPVKPPHLALKITAMALSIVGMVFLSMGGLYTLIGLAAEGVALGMAVAFALFFLPLSIVGLCLSVRCQNGGDTSAFSRVGKALGFAGIAVAAGSLLLGILSLGMY